MSQSATVTVGHNSILKMTGRVKQNASGFSCQRARHICVGRVITGVSSSLLTRLIRKYKHQDLLHTVQIIYEYIVSFVLKSPATSTNQIVLAIT